MADIGNTEESRPLVKVVHDTVHQNNKQRVNNSIKKSNVISYTIRTVSFLRSRTFFSQSQTIDRILELCEGGFVCFGVNHLPTIPRADTCFTENNHGVSRIAPIRLTDLTSAFLILGIGLTRLLIGDANFLVGNYLFEMATLQTLLTYARKLLSHNVIWRECMYYFPSKE
jgi:hypothetical protein